VFPIQSLTDQQSFRLMPSIAAASPLAITPEQAGVWSSVDGSMSNEDLAFSLITSLLFRVHLAGRIDTLAPAQRTIVRDGLATYRELRSTIGTGTTFWPLGLPGWRDDWIAVGRRTTDEVLLAVWRREGDAKITMPLPAAHEVEVVYPRWGGELLTALPGALEIALPPNSARLLRLK
jgi:alpha-galactosidase